VKPVLIVLDKDNKSEWHDLRCIQCGRKLCNVNRLVKYAYLDNVDQMVKELDKPMVEIKCRGCEAIYSVLIQ
jgi:ribosomal protein S27E